MNQWKQKTVSELKETEETSEETGYFTISSFLRQAGLWSDDQKKGHTVFFNDLFSLTSMENVLRSRKVMRKDM